MPQLRSLLLRLMWSCVMSIQSVDSEKDICLPMPTANGNDDYKALPDLEDPSICKNSGVMQLSAVSLFLRNCSGQMEHIRSKIIDIKGRPDPVKYFYLDLHLPANVGGYFLLNIFCLLDSQSELNCSWNAADIPNGVQYSTSAVLCDGSEVPTHWNCSAYTLGNLTGCQGKTISEKDNSHIIMQVNVSLPGFWYIHTEHFDKSDIEKLDPPKIANYSFKRQHGDCILEIQWEKNHEKNDCLTYEIKINDDVVPISGQDKYIVSNVDQTKTYTVCMRVTMSEHCTLASHGAPWSDWSKPVVMGPAEESKPGYSTVMLLSIVLGLPMILLVFLLVFFKLQRIVFPPIPNPRIRVKSLLERDYPNQTLPRIDAEEVCIEEVTEMNE